MTILSIGEILWDVIQGTEHLGGAPFNFAAHARRLGHDVRFISAVGADARGRLALARAGELGLSTRFVRVAPDRPTGIVTVALDAGGQPRFTIHRPAAYDFPHIREEDLRELLDPPPDWIYFGTLQQSSAEARALTARLMEAAPAAKRFYDVNLRAGCYTASLVGELIRRAAVVKLNEEEVCVVEQMMGMEQDRPALRDEGAAAEYGDRSLIPHGGTALMRFCERGGERFGWEAACVTRAAAGCVAWVGGQSIEAPG
jgi:fructokinase